MQTWLTLIALATLLSIQSCHCALLPIAPSTRFTFGGGNVELTWDQLTGHLSLQSGSQTLFETFGEFVELKHVQWHVGQWSGDYHLTETIIAGHVNQTVDTVSATTTSDGSSSSSSSSAVITGRLTFNEPNLQPVGYNLTMTIITETKKCASSSSSSSSSQLELKLTTSGIDASFSSSPVPDPTNPSSYLLIDTPSLGLIVSSDASEHIYGLGVMYGSLDLKNRTVPVWVREGGLGRGLEPLTSLCNLFRNYSGGAWYTTYAPVPFFLTSDQRALLLQDSHFAEMDFSVSDRLRVRVFAKEWQARFFWGSDMPAVLGEYTSVVGRMQPLPSWAASGAMVGMQGGRSVVTNVVNQLVEMNTPVTALWLQDWVGSRIVPWGQGLWWNWQPDETLYPDWSGFVSEMRARGIRVLGYINPMLKDVSSRANMSISYRNLWSEAMSFGYFVKDSTGRVWQGYDGASMVDLTNANATRWLKDVIKSSMLGSGMSGWMADFGESLPLDAQLSDGSVSPLVAHNLWPVLWQRLNKEAVSEFCLEQPSHCPDDGSNDVVYFVRSGYTGSVAETPLQWLGDQLVSFDPYDGLQSAVISSLTSGLSGFTLTHTDIGGYQAVNYPQLGLLYRRSKELLLRWAEVAAFSAAFRTHDGSDPKLNWLFYSDADTMQAYSRLANLFAASYTYRQRLMKEATELGLPMIRPMFLHAPTVPAAYNLSQQFFFGSEWVVLPVLQANTSSVAGWLPQGDWVLIWRPDDVSYSISDPQGSWVTLPAPMGQPAVVFRSGCDSGAEFVSELQRRGLLPGTGGGGGSVWRRPWIYIALLVMAVMATSAVVVSRRSSKNSSSSCSSSSSSSSSSTTATAAGEYHAIPATATL